MCLIIFLILIDFKLEQRLKIWWLILATFLATKKDKFKFEILKQTENIPLILLAI